MSADSLEQEDYGFRWGNVHVIRAFFRRSPRGTVHRCLFVRAGNHKLEVYVTGRRGQMRVFLDGRELL